MYRWLVMLLSAVLGVAFATAATAQNFDDPKDFEYAKQLLAMKPQGPEGKPWLQNLGGKEVDTSKYKKAGPYRICFSNAGVDNPWRVVGWTDMQAQVDASKADIKSFTAADAGGKDDKQISDINSFVSGDQCDILIVSPNTTAALTPAVEAACKKLPVVIFDRGVLTQCPVTFVNPIGGYGWGIQTANFIAEKLPEGRQGAGLAHPARRRRAGDALVGGQSHLQGEGHQRRRRRIHRRRQRQDQVDRRRLSQALRQDRCDLDGRRRDGCRGDRGVRGRRPALRRSSPARIRKTSWSSGRRTS